MVRTRNEVRGNKLIKMFSWKSDEVKITVEAYRDATQYAPSIEKEFTTPEEFLKAIGFFRYLTKKGEYDEVGLTIMPKNYKEYPRFSISINERGEISVVFSIPEESPDHEKIKQALQKLKEAETLLNEV